MHEPFLVRTSAFIKARFEARDEDRFWLCCALAVGAGAGLTFLIRNLGGAPGVENDARQFLSWMSRFDDPASLRGDLLADYWQSVSPWFFTLAYRAAWAIGIEPLTFARILPALLLLLGSLASYRFVRSIGAEPLVAALTAALIVIVLAHDDAVLTATPRAFRPILFLALMDGLSRRGVIQSALAQLMLAGTYPQTALVMATVIGLTLLKPAAPFIDLRRRSLVLVIASAIATVAGILPFLVASRQFDPIVTLAQAMAMPNFGLTGRNRLADGSGSLNFLCGNRLGLLGIDCNGTFSTIELVLAAAAIVAGSVLLLLRALRRPPGAGVRSTLPFLVLIASLAWFAVSIAVLFRLHLPSRYTATLALLAPLCAAPLILEWLREAPFMLRLFSGRHERLAYAVTTLAIIVAAVGGAVNGSSVIERPPRPALIDFIRATPQDAVMAGFVVDLDFSPVLTARSTLFSRELSIGYQLGYLRPVLQRMADMRDAALTHDPAVLADRLAVNHVDYLFVPDDMLAVPKIPKGFRGFFDADALAQSEAAAASGGPTALALAADRCAKATFGSVRVFDGACLIGNGAH